MSAIDINAWMTSLLGQLRHCRQRQLVAMLGDESWCRTQFHRLQGMSLSRQVLSNRHLCAAAVPFSKAENCLGGEAELVVLDFFTGFNPDVLCIAAGLVQAGGVLVILSPPVDAWDIRQDRYALWQDQCRSLQPYFVQYFFNALERDEQIGVFLGPDSWPSPRVPMPELQATPIEDGVTPEQFETLRRIEQWLASGEAGVALIHADRGRGKSTCLGLLARRRALTQRILVSASSRQAAAALLRTAPEIEFIAPDQLLQQLPAADLLLVDEAAMMPLSMLRRLQRHYPRLVMATTDGGYEGTGKGFMLRFAAKLETPGLLRLGLHKPVRWCAGDQFETWLNRTLMLTATAPAEPPSEIAGYRLEFLPRPAAAESLALVQQAYRLLNAAHYRTRPSDLRSLMENPDQAIIVARLGASVVGVLLLNFEGGFDAALSEQIFFGRRRPRGHLLAQMLTAQAGIENFAEFRGLRIQRIAVAPGCRRQGLGRALVASATQFARENSIDYIGASFALDPVVAEFWHRLGFSLVHVSFAPGKSTGNHSVAVVQSINPRLDEIRSILKHRLNQQLPVWLTQFLQNLAAPEVACLLHYAGYHSQLSELEQREVAAFARGNKGFELSFVSVQKFVMQRLADTGIAPNRLLIEKAVQNRAWQILERESGAEGRKQLQRRLRGYVEALIQAD